MTTSRFVFNPRNQQERDKMMLDTKNELIRLQKIHRCNSIRGLCDKFQEANNVNAATIRNRINDKRWKLEVMSAVGDEPKPHWEFIVHRPGFEQNSARRL